MIDKKIVSGGNAGQVCLPDVPLFRFCPASCGFCMNMVNARFKDNPMTSLNGTL
jgi:hypothetical protein